MARLVLMYILIAIPYATVATSDPETSAPATSDPATSDPATSVPATSVPATSDPATSDPATSDPATSDPATSVPAANSLPTLIPDTFYYNCTQDGGIKIINDANSLANVKINYLNNSASNCSDPKTEDDGSIAIATCKMNTKVTIVLEAENTTGILGGRHSKTFQIKCDEMNIQPYLLNVTFTENVGKKVTPHVITMATEPSPMSSLTMTIKDKNSIATEASIGQELTVAITIPEKTTIKPTECKASGNGQSVTLWLETGCKHDDELFGEKWRNESGVVTNRMYGFRFVGSSTSITITCTVRVCPEGYRGTECDLTTCESGKRKRSTRLSETVTIQKATTSLTIRDPLMTSRAGRQGYELNTIIGLALATVVFLKITFFQG